MNSTALEAKKENISFISEAHEKFYYEKLKEVRYQDVYHKALCYCLGISDDTRRNANRIYDFKTGCVKTECLHEGWQTSGSVKVAIIERQIDEIGLAIAQAKADDGECYTIKQMEKSRKSLLTRLEKVAGGDTEKPMPLKAKGKEETL